MKRVAITAFIILSTLAFLLVALTSCAPTVVQGPAGPEGSVGPQGPEGDYRDRWDYRGQRDYRDRWGRI